MIRPRWASGGARAINAHINTNAIAGGVVSRGDGDSCGYGGGAAGGAGAPLGPPRPTVRDTSPRT